MSAAVVEACHRALRLLSGALAGAQAIPAPTRSPREWQARHAPVNTADDAGCPAWVYLRQRGVTAAEIIRYRISYGVTGPPASLRCGAG